MIKVSDTAKKKIIDLMKDDGFDAATDYVRVGVKSGGCSGLSYDLKFDKTKTSTNAIKAAIDETGYKVTDFKMAEKH